MDKITFMRLWDIYHGLLTQTQQEITDMYFNLDLTVSEIAEEKGISRQGVSDCMKICKKQLEEYESKLHFAKKLTEISLEISFLLTDASRWAEEIRAAHPELKGEIGGLSDIIGKDYSEEVAKALQDPEALKVLNKGYTKDIEEF